MNYLNLPTGMGEIILHEEWRVHLAAARYLNNNSIEVRSADDFASIVDRDVCYSILPWEGHFIVGAGLEYCDGVWCFVAELAVDDPTLDLIAEVAVFDIENQQAAWRIKAFLECHTGQEVSA